jgi:hypothetical protein
MPRWSTAAMIAVLLAVASGVSASSAVAVASARVIRATIVSTGPLVGRLSVTAADFRQGYISLQGASVNSGRTGAAAFTVRVEIPAINASMSFAGDTRIESSRMAVSGSEASLRPRPFAYITYDGQ